MNETLGQILAVVREVLGKGSVLLASTLATDMPEWDSHTTVQIIFAIEDHFGFEMSSSEMERIDGIGAIARVVGAHIGKVA